MLGYLVPSRVRRRLLELLWRHGEVGSASHLAKRARVGFATAYRELKRMEEFGLVTTRVAKGREEYMAATDHPDAELVRRLVCVMPSPAPSGDEADRVRGRLRALGAPLPVPPTPVIDDEREQALVDGIRLAHRDATLFRALPVVVWKQWPALDRKRLKDRARRAREKHALGFVVALTGQLSGDESLTRWAEGLRDHRVTGARSFLELPSTQGSRLLATRRTPEVARNWGYLMDLDYESFKSAFDKSAGGDS